MSVTEGGVTTTSFYDGLLPVMERQGSTTTATNLWGLSYGGGIGGLLARTTSARARVFQALRTHTGGALLHRIRQTVQVIEGDLCKPRLGLAKRIRHYPHQLSGGEQQRVAIARALINDPVLLLTDEPTANIDSVTAQRIVETFDRLNRERKLAILMVTHERELAARANRMIELKDGVIVRGG